MIELAPETVHRARPSPFSLALLARRLRGIVRGSEAWLVLLGAFCGIASGLSVALMGTAANAAHTFFFRVHNGHLSGMAHLEKGFLTPVVGGVVLGVGGWLWNRRRRAQPIDPIEANALHGGRMSLRDSVWVTAQTLLSNGCGASVGLEAGYAQIGSGIASKLGMGLRLRRNDLRVLVGCGAGGAIGAAFGAPLTGAFYAFELIVGSYSVSNVAPILAASVTGVLTARIARAVTYHIAVAPAAPTLLSSYAAMLLLGVLCAGFGVVVMRAVALSERAFAATRLPRALRPALGGAIMVGLAMITPEVLSAGHGALRLDMTAELSMTTLLALIGLKTLASVVSLGSGFRGGLFFASLFLGALIGKLFATVLALFAPHFAVDPSICTLVGMAALAVAVIGGPLTMAFLVLETTGDFAVTAVVLASSIATALVVRETFGYSFSTWRLHLRGESIRSAVDVGWMRLLTVARMMRRDPDTIPGSASLEELRRRFPLGSTQRVVVVDESGGYLGIALTAEAFASADHPEQDTTKTCADIARWGEAPLLPEMNIKQAVSTFDRSESEALAVVEDLEGRQVIGLLTEGYALRRYAEELDKARSALAGG